MKYVAILLSSLLISGLFINSGYAQNAVPDPPESGIIQVGGVFYHRDVTPENTFDSPPTPFLQSTSFERQFSDQDVEECRTVEHYDIMQTKMQRYRIDLYETVEKWTGWDYVGVGLIVVGVAALVVVTGGLAGVGVAAGIGAATAASAGTLAGAAITGGSAMIITNTGHEKTTNLVKTEYMDIPIEAPRTVDTRMIESPWVPCLKSITR